MFPAIEISKFDFFWLDLHAEEIARLTYRTINSTYVHMMHVFIERTGGFHVDAFDDLELIELYEVLENGSSFGFD